MGCRGFPARAVPPYEAVTAGPGKRGRHQVRAAIRLRRSHSHIFSGLSAPSTFIGSARKHEFVWASTISARYRADAVGSATPRQHRQPCPFRTSEAGGPSCTAHGLQPRHHSTFSLYREDAGEACLNGFLNVVVTGATAARGNGTHSARRSGSTQPSARRRRAPQFRTRRGGQGARHRGG